MWVAIKSLYLINFFIISFLGVSFINRIFINIKSNKKIVIKNKNYDKNSLKILIGKNDKNEEIYISEKGLYQNILITGTIGSGKTSSAMYPITQQLMEYKCADDSSKIGMLILDVKGNYYKQVKKYAEKYNRMDDLVVIELGGKYKYNPLDKKGLKASVLANRLKIILELFSGNTSESYWIDKSEQIICEAIKLCRLYNDEYVTFKELHSLITDKEYYDKKVKILKENYLNNKYKQEECYDLLTAISFFEKEFFSLDLRSIAILKSQITRITNCFISDYQVSQTFSPSKLESNFSGIKDIIERGKIVVLNMNIAEYKNLSKIIAAYLKLDFQSEVMLKLANPAGCDRSVAFISDEYHEYITETDSDFFAQSREAKCINVVATQSYKSMLKTLNNEATLSVITQNLINKLWFRTDDLFTIEEAQKQIGKEEKEKISTSVSENARETKYSYITRDFKSKDSNISESINSSYEKDFIFDSNFFTQNLETFTAIGFLSDGSKIIKPQKINLIPYFIKESDLL